jgi:hypothetical protein
MIDIHIEPQFEGLRREMKRYPSQVIDKATVRTLNRLGAQSKTIFVRGVSKHFGVPAKTLRYRIRVSKASKDKHRVVVTMQRSRSSRNKSGISLTVGSLLKHLDDAAFQRRIGNDKRFASGSGEKGFARAPKSFRLGFARESKKRMPLEILRVDLLPVFQTMKRAAEAKARATYPQEWRKNADYFKGRMKKKYTR